MFVYYFVILAWRLTVELFRILVVIIVPFPLPSQYDSHWPSFSRFKFGWLVPIAVLFVISLAFPPVCHAFAVPSYSDMKFFFAGWFGDSG